MVVTRRVVREDATSLESKKGKKLQYNDYARETKKMKERRALESLGSSLSG